VVLALLALQSLLSTMCVNMVDAGSDGGSADQDLGEELPQSLAVHSTSNNLDSNHTTASSSVGRQQQVSRLHVVCGWQDAVSCRAVLERVWGQQGLTCSAVAFVQRLCGLCGMPGVPNMGRSWQPSSEHDDVDHSGYCTVGVALALAFRLICLVAGGVNAG
jgi:hypothetical protein